MIPPLTRRFCPEIHRASSLTKSATTSAMFWVGEGDVRDCFGKSNDPGKPALRRLVVLPQQLRTSPLSASAPGHQGRRTDRGPGSFTGHWCVGIDVIDAQAAPTVPPRQSTSIISVLEHR